jgi:hypothetical protein
VQVSTLTGAGAHDNAPATIERPGHAWRSRECAEADCGAMAGLGPRRSVLAAGKRNRSVCREPFASSDTLVGGGWEAVLNPSRSARLAFG